MRILHLGKFYPPFAGGMEYFLADLLRAQAAKGTSVAALVHDERPSGRGAYPDAADTVQVYRAPCHGRLLYAPVSPAFPIWLNRIIKAYRPDLLHLHLPNTSVFAALALPRARALPWVIHWHSDVVASAIDRRLAMAYRLYRPFEQRLLAKSRAIIATSPAYLDSSLALRPWRNQCQVVPLGLDPARIPDPDPSALAEAEALWGGRGLRILAIGRLTYYKGHEILIRAASRDPQNRVLVIGSGDRRTQLRVLVQSLRLSEQVSLLGFQPDSRLNALLATCDLLCLPSLERTEAFGLVLLEAMRFGKPVIASDIPGSGTGWVVRQAGHGLLTSPGDSDELATAIANLRNDAGLRNRLGHAGRMALQDQFSMPRIASAIDGIYEQIAG